MYSAHGYELTSNCVLYFYLLKLSYMETTSVGSLWRLKKNGFYDNRDVKFYTIEVKLITNVLF